MTEKSKNDRSKTATQTKTVTKMQPMPRLSFALFFKRSLSSFFEVCVLQQQAAGSCFDRPPVKAAKHLLFIICSESYRWGRDIKRSITVWMFHIHILLKRRRWKRKKNKQIQLRFLSLLICFPLHYTPSFIGCWCRFCVACWIFSLFFPDMSCQLSKI